MLASAVAEAGFLVALLAVRPPEEHALSALSVILLCISAVGALGAVTVAWAALRLMTWDGYPSTLSTWQLAHDRMDTFTWEMGRTLEVAYENNVINEKRKARRVKWSSRFILALTALTFATALALVFT